MDMQLLADGQLLQSFTIKIGEIAGLGTKNMKGSCLLWTLSGGTKIRLMSKLRQGRRSSDFNFVNGGGGVAQLRQGVYPANQDINQVHQYQNGTDKQYKSTCRTIIAKPERNLGNYSINKSRDKTADSKAGIVITHHQLIG